VWWKKKKKAKEKINAVFALEPGYKWGEKEDQHS
jgi:hypothetical protein